MEYTIVENEYVDSNNGNLISYNGWDRTNFIEVNSYKTLYIYNNASSRTKYCAQYSSNDASSFIRSFNVEIGLTKLNLDMNCKYIVISSARRLNVMNQLSIFNNLYIDPIKSTTYLNSNNLINTNYVSGTLDNDGNYTYYEKRLTSDFIELKYHNAEIQVELKEWLVLIHEYDENKNHIYTQQRFITSNFNIITNPQTKYIRFCINHKNDMVIYTDDIYQTDTFVHYKPIVKKLKVMTYNIGHYAYGTGMGLTSDIYEEKLRNYRIFLGNNNDIDVIGIQEYDSWMNDADTEDNAILANDVLWDHYYPYDKATGSWGAIKSKEFMYWKYIAQLSTNRYYVKGYINGICLISVHLSVGKSNTQTRLNEADEILSILQNEERVIIFGDFNCEPGEEDQLYSKFTNAGYNIANCGWFGKYYTWSNKRSDFDNYTNPTGTTIYYIDNIIVSSNINIVNVYPIPEAYSLLSSDHIPFVAELEMN